jgi:hypothetical protein
MVSVFFVGFPTLPRQAGKSRFLARQTGRARRESIKFDNLAISES